MPLPGTDIWGCANRKASSRGPGSNTINLSLTQALVVTVTNKTQVHQTISVHAVAGSSFLGVRDVCATIHRETLGVGRCPGDTREQKQGQEPALQGNIQHHWCRIKPQSPLWFLPLQGEVPAAEHPSQPNPTLPKESIISTHTLFWFIIMLILPSPKGRRLISPT